MKDALESHSVFLDYSYCLDGRTRFYIQTVVDPCYSFSVFASHKIINIIREHISPGQRQYLMDGTFKIVPRSFYQLLIISIEFMNDVCIYIYMYIIVNHIDNSILCLPYSFE